MPPLVSLIFDLADPCGQRWMRRQIQGTKSAPAVFIEAEVLPFREDVDQRGIIARLDGCPVRPVFGLPIS